MDKKIFKNSSFLLIANIFVKTISFVYVIFLARNLGVANFGLYTAALAYFSLVSSVADLGFNRFLIREGAKDHNLLNKYLSTTIAIRTLVNLAIFIIFAVGLSYLDNDPARMVLSVWAVLAVLPQSIALSFDAALVAKQKLKLSAWSLSALSVATSAIGVFLVLSGFGVFGAVAALIVGHVIYTIILGFLLHLNNINFLENISTKLLMIIIKGSLPYGILLVLGLLYFKIDSLMLIYIKGAQETGIYGAAYKFLEAAMFIPSALATAMFPVVAKIGDKNNKEIKRMYLSSVKFLGLLSIPIFLAFIFLIPIFIQLLLPEYLNSINALKILSFTIPFMFIHIPAALILLSCEKYLKTMILLSIFTLSFNVITNFVLIPTMGYIGASITTVASEILSFIVFFTLIYKKILKYA